MNAKLINIFKKSIVSNNKKKNHYFVFVIHSVQNSLWVLDYNLVS